MGGNLYVPLQTLEALAFMKKIKLTQGKYALVDDLDFRFLNQWKWHYLNIGYAARRDYSNNGTYLLMHRVILNTPKGLETDHKNGNKLDNRRLNIRICTKSENSFNKNKQNNNTSGFKGVFWRKDRSKWKVKIGKINVGLFSDKVMAAKAYDKKAKELFGEFVRLNFK